MRFFLTQREKIKIWDFKGEIFQTQRMLAQPEQIMTLVKLFDPRPITIFDCQKQLLLRKFFEFSIHKYVGSLGNERKLGLGINFFFINCNYSDVFSCQNRKDMSKFCKYPCISNQFDSVLFSAYFDRPLPVNLNTMDDVIGIQRVDGGGEIFQALLL